MGTQTSKSQSQGRALASLWGTNQFPGDFDAQQSLEIISLSPCGHTALEYGRLGTHRKEEGM